LSLNLETRIGRLLQERGNTLALAESCTGGLISDRITNVPGSSRYFLGSVIAYAYQAKVDLLGVSWEALHSYGAVSREVVLEMAEGARHTLKADLAASVSGIAGPEGGTPNKPVGKVWIALAAPDGAWTREYHFPGSRQAIKSFSADAVLQLVMDYLEGKL
jgi:nicotinamide-nucleotide amidase